MTSGCEHDEDEDEDEDDDDDDDEDDPKEEGSGGGGRRRHASRMRLGANIVRTPMSGANDDGRALDTFHERRVRGSPRLDVVVAAGMRPIVVLMMTMN